MQVNFYMSPELLKNMADGLWHRVMVEAESDHEPTIETSSVIRIYVDGDEVPVSKP